MSARTIYSLCAPAALASYRYQLGFDMTFQEPADVPFFGIVKQGHPGARWDANLYVSDPNALAADLAARNVT